MLPGHGRVVDWVLLSPPAGRSAAATVWSQSSHRYVLLMHSCWGLLRSFLQCWVGMVLGDDPIPGRNLELQSGYGPCSYVCIVGVVIVGAVCSPD
ncbi:hypothetical protein Nepgr_002712 [Nepenthes gracilis]|uniref:Uncharacterized protein n=1 Tax=Nepenthes gracilis TaxID=150966 RepID=A0AAD3RYE8_NEPGR|nr:hypothetical protein Nepgr_002712 [Nepenthes gracilis]